MEALACIRVASIFLKIKSIKGNAMKTHMLTGLQRIVLLGSIAVGLTPAASVAQQLSYASQALPAMSCTQLNAFLISPSQIGKPTTGAQVVSAVLMPASGSGPTAFGEYCQVTVDIRPVDGSAPNIQVLMKLPTTWNRKSMMFGGGGFDGNFNFIDFVHAGLDNQVTPLARGYAVFGSDSGHKLHPPFIFGRDGSFATNNEALANYASDALKKTHDTAKVIIARYYGSHPEKSYFHGGSMGGREGLMVAHYWPDQFDGVISIFPVVSATGWFLQMSRISQAMARPGAWLNDAKRQLVYRTGIQACDALDGVVDGVISNMAACNALFKIGDERGELPAAVAAVRCSGGGDTGDFCLSDAQINLLNTFSTGTKFDHLSTGAHRYPGYNVWGADLGIASTKAELALSPVLGLNAAPPINPVWVDQPYMSTLSDQWWKYFVTRDVNFNSLSQNPSHLGVWRSRVNDLSAMLDVSSDLSAFRARGGKLLVMHGKADILVSPRATEQYFQALANEMGQQAVRGFARFFEAPGLAHSMGASFNAGWDSITALENWVEHGIEPLNQIVSDKTGIVGRSRPLCEFPLWPRYNGYGDVNSASSFHCVGTDDDDDDGHGDRDSNDD
jgi:feruloyl esterase